MTTASYNHVSAPVTTQGGLACNVEISIAFVDVPAGKNGDPIASQAFENMYRAQPSEEDGSYTFVIEPSDGSTDIERAHRGCQNAVRLVASGRGFTVDFDDITYSGGL